MSSTRISRGRSLTGVRRTLSGRTSGALIAALAVLFAANIFDPLGALGLKYLAFVVAALSSLWALKYFDLSSRAIAIGLLLFVAWPTWSLLYGVVRGGDVTVGLTQVTPFAFAVLLAAVLPALDSRRPLRAFYACISLLALVVVAAVVLIVFLPENAISRSVFGYFTSLEGKEGSFGSQTFDGIEVPWIYFSSTLFLVPAFVYYLFIQRLLRAGVVLLALGLTFSKAGVTIALIFGAIYSVFVLFRPQAASASGESRARWRLLLRRFAPISILGAASFLIFFSLPTFSDQIADAWAGKSDTAQVRIGHFRSVTDLFITHPGILLVGQGAGVSFYSLGESTYVQSFEIDYLNAIRKFGLPWFLAYSFLVFYCARSLIKTAQIEERAFGLALISGYFAAGTNPELLSSLFVTLLTLSYFAQRCFPTIPQVANVGAGLRLSSPEEAGA